MGKNFVLIMSDHLLIGCFLEYNQKNQSTYGADDYDIDVSRRSGKRPPEYIEEMVYEDNDGFHLLKLNWTGFTGSFGSFCSSLS